MKIVVAVDKDKESIFTRIGRAPYFAIYEDEKLDRVITNAHAASHEGEHGAHAGHGHGGGGHGKGGGHKHHESYSAEEVAHHRRDIQALEGCDVILARAVGPNMKEALKSIGLKVQKISKADGEKANEVVAKFLSHQLKRQ